MQHTQPWSKVVLLLADTLQNESVIKRKMYLLLRLTHMPERTVLRDEVAMCTYIIGLYCWGCMSTMLWPVEHFKTFWI